MVLIGVITAALAGAIVTGRTVHIHETVGSAWEEIPMLCDTTRWERGGTALELFECRALGGGRLPPGRYLSPDSQWSSDLTGRPAVASAIRITRDGDLAGFAVY